MQQYSPMRSSAGETSAATLHAGPVHDERGAASAATMLCGWAGVASPPDAARATVARIGEGAATSTHAVPIRVLDSHAGMAAAGGHCESLQADGASVLLVGRPCWLGSGNAEHVGLARRVLQEYRASGKRVLESLGGAFTLVLTEDGGRNALLAIDRMGVASLTYAQLGDGVVFGTTVGLAASCLDARPKIDLQSVFNYVFLHFVPGPATIYRGQRRIPPGGYVEIRDGKLESGRYWRARYDELADYDLDALKREFRDQLERSVRGTLGYGRIGAFLSGGTDSSTIAGLLAQIGGAPARTYSIGFEAAGYDEMAYARIAARHFATDHHEYYVTPDDVIDFAPRMAAHCDQPFGNASAVPAYYCAQLAKSDGVDVLLGGDGGDELFGGNERYATQAMFSWYEHAPRALREGVIEPVLFGIPGGERLAPVRKARNYVRQALIPVPMRLHAYNMLRRNAPESVFTADFLASVNPATPLDLLTDVYDGAHAHGPLNRMLALDLQFTLADNDLYKVSRMCELAGVEVAYPMLADGLVAFSMRLPAHLKLKGTRLRHFFKESLRDFLPREIIAKRKHGFGLPVGIWMQTHAPLRGLVYDAVRALGTRGIIQPSFVERIIAEHQADYATYWGGEIWVLSQLELWLAQHGYPPGQPLA
jgi:asparagine synthase (glutamine-hydrolysing)